MNILFLSYWGLNEGLTAATVFPHLKILADFPHIKKIFLVTIEREKVTNLSALPNHEKIFHHILISKRPLPNILNKVYDFFDFPSKLVKLCKREKIDKIIARGAPPGALAMMVKRKCGIPFYVESFEPHSAYMHESGTWKWYDPRYIYQKRWEKQQLKEAAALMPVAENFRRVLLAEGVAPEKIDVIPCCVPLDEFSFNEEKGAKTRKRLSIGNKVVGIYTGKFGGIYYHEDSFKIFREAFRHFSDNFFLIILSPDDVNWISQKIAEHQLPTDSVYVASVNHSEVPDYLSAADFAFSLQSPKPSNLYLSPIKNAEYWASGLPILMTNGVGDDSQIIMEENAGAVFRGIDDLEGIESGLQLIETLLQQPDIRVRLNHLASKYRNFSIVKEVYRKWYF